MSLPSKATLLLAASIGALLAFSGQQASATSYAQPEVFPRDAGSWGGKIRSGPGMQYRQIGSTSNGQTITIQQNSGQYMDRYPWFRIMTRDGRVGYQWGGIMCSVDGKTRGLADNCSWTVGQTSKPPVNNGGGRSQTRTVTYDCQNGPPLIVTYTRLPHNNVSVRYVYDGPQHAMRSMVRTHANHFRDGENSLAMRPDPRNVEYREGNNLFDRCRAVSGM